jgi:hypothetical protein
MLSENIFDGEMRRIKALTGRNLESREQRDLIFSKLKKCNQNDFKNACDDDDLIEEVGRYGLNYAVIRKHVSRYRVRREVEEARIKNIKMGKNLKQNNITQSDEFKRMMERVKGL